MAITTDRAMSFVSVPSLPDDSVAWTVLCAMRAGLLEYAVELAGGLDLGSLGLDERRVVACAYSMRGHSLIAHGLREGVGEMFESAVRADPSGVELCFDWAWWLVGKGRFEDALAWSCRVASFGGRNAVIHGKALCGAGRYGAGIEVLRGVVEGGDDEVRTEALMELGCALRDSGQPEIGLAKMVESGALDEMSRSVRCMSMLYATDDAVQIEQAHREYGSMVAWKSVERGAVEPLNGRRLCVGLMSSDFRRHSCAHFLMPIVKSVDRSQIWVVLVTTRRPDPECSVWRAFADSCDLVVDVSGMNDASAAESVERLGIDVLIDCNGLTGGHRQGVMALHPAPLCGTFLGYPARSGLPTNDFHVGDAFADKNTPGDDLLRLGGMWCYDPLDTLPNVRERRAGPLRFGVFNAAAKHSWESLRFWAGTLNENPGSLLVVKNRAYNDDATFAFFLDRMESLGVERHRVEQLEYRTSASEALDDYNLIDVQLDTLPYNGTTTTCESLLMGVPVLTRAGKCHHARVSESILRSVGCEGFDAHPNTLGMRLDLRERFLASPVCDSAGYAERFGSALLGLWEARSMA